MNKFYVTKDVAEKLRAKGYYREYDVTSEWVEGIFYQVEDGTFHLPRIDEVLAWLREEKKIFVEIVITPMGLYKPMIYDIGGFKKPYRDISPRINFNEAAIAGIEYVIDNLI